MSAVVRGEQGLPPLDVLWYGVLLAGPVALLFRRTRPVLAYAVALAAAVALFRHGYADGPFYLAALAGMFVAVRAGKRSAVWGWTAAGFAVAVFTPPITNPTKALVIALWVGAALAVAEGVRSRSEWLAESARARAEAERARAEADRARAEQSRRQASEERLRIVGELHDVLGHHLSLINMRAGVALHVSDKDPAEARAALAAIKEASAEALREVRGVLKALASAQVGDSAPRSPSGGLADVDRLVAEARGAGLTVSVETTGPVRPLPAEVDRAAYRIVREALTNVRRHAGPDATVALAIGYDAEEVTVRVTDTGLGTSTVDGEGAGIPGMRERAAALGGRLTAGPGPAGGFEVAAVLPTTREAT